MTHKLPLYAGLLSLMVCAGCYQTAQIYTAQANYYQGRFDAAAERLDLNEIPKRDALLALLEKGMSLQAAGRYAESAEAWRAAETLMEQQDMFHAGEEALSLVLDQTVLTYQPAPYEKPFLHALLALDYLQVGDPQSARVEAVKSLADLDKRESVVGPIAFVRYVAALVYESVGDANDAYIEYKKIHKAGVSGMLPALVRISSALGFEEDRAAYVAAMGDSEIPSAERERSVIVFLGRSPRKVSSEVVLADNYKILLPVFQTQSRAVYGAELRSSAGESIRAGIQLTSVENLASTLSGRLFSGELLKEVLRHKVQKNIVNKVGDKLGSTTEELLKTVFFFAKEPDLRTWSSLPAAVYLVRVPSSAGSDLEVRYTDQTHQPASHESDTVVFPSNCPSPVTLLRAW